MHPVKTRSEKREFKQINETLIKLTLEFIAFIKRTFDANKDQELIAKKYIEYETAWKNYCKKKFQFHKPHFNAFEKSIAQNIYMSGIKK